MLTLTWKLTGITQRGSDHYPVMNFTGTYSDGGEWFMAWNSNEQLMNDWRQVRANGSKSKVKQVYLYY